MLTAHKSGQPLLLLQPDDLVSPGNWKEIGTRLIPYYLLVMWWAENFLTRPNNEVGRAGPVCPFVRPALDCRTFWFTAIEGAEPPAATLESTLLAYRDWFVELPPETGEDAQNKTILILLPDIPRPRWSKLIDGTQKRLKPDFIKQQLMIGQFHPDCEEPGVKNPTFRPLKSPVPMLVIRRITAGDIVFMRSHDGHYDPTYLHSYLRTFAKGIPASFIQEVTRTLAETDAKSSVEPSQGA